MRKTLFKNHRRPCPGQDRVLRYIIDYKVCNDGNSPSYTQIARGVGIARSTVYMHIKHLSERGKLVCDWDQGVVKLVGGQYVPPPI